jgi:VWFA-related protein
MQKLLLVIAVVTLNSSVFSQDQNVPRFSAAINYVELTVRVVDATGNFVRNMQQAEFQVLEDGRPQAIANFGLVDMPIQTPKADSTASSTAEPLSTEELRKLDGRLYIFLLDDYHLPSEHSSRARTIVRGFIQDRLGSNDAAAVIFASGVRGQQFTQDRNLLISAVDRFRGLFDYREPARVKEVKARAVIQVMTDLAADVESIQGRRKVLIYMGISVGCLVALETNPHRDAGFVDRRSTNLSSAGTGEAEDASATLLCRNETLQAVRLLTRAGVVVYSMDPRASNNPAWVSPTVDGRGGPGAARNRMSLVEAGRPSIFDAFFVVADQTGGFAVTGTSAFNPVLDRIVRENSSYYVIGYYSTNEVADGKFRNNEIKLSRDRLKAFYRKGYYAPEKHP